MLNNNCKKDLSFFTKKNFSQGEKMEKLKPCPKCKSEKVEVFHSYNDPWEEGAVMCNDCGYRIKFESGGAPAFEAVKEWNKEADTGVLNHENFCNKNFSRDNRIEANRLGGIIELSLVKDDDKFFIEPIVLASNSSNPIRIPIDEEEATFTSFSDETKFLSAYESKIEAALSEFEDKIIKILSGK